MVQQIQDVVYVTHTFRRQPLTVPVKPTLAPAPRTDGVVVAHGVAPVIFHRIRLPLRM